MRTQAEGLATLVPADVVDALEAIRLRRQRRRRATWIGFLLLGLMTSTVWALGFASAEAEIGTEASAPVVVGTAGGTTAGTYTAGISSPQNITIDFNGTWGVLNSDFSVYDVNLTDPSSTPTDGTYFFTIVLDQVPQNFVAVQLEWVLFGVNAIPGAGEVAGCDATTDLTGAGAPLSSQVMAIQDEDASAVFTGLGGGSEFCVGVRQMTPRADDPAGTFIRRQSGSVTPIPPTFIGVLNRSS